MDIDFNKALSDIKEGKYNNIYIYSTLNLGWNTPMKQRTHHLAEEQLKRGNLIFYAVNPSHIKDRVKTILKQRDFLYLVNFNDSLNKDKIINMIFSNTKSPVIYHLIGTDFGNTIKDIEYIKSLGGVILYEYIDEISNDIIPNIPSYVFERHKRILNDASNIVVVTSDKLKENILPFRKGDYLVLKNGVTLEDWIIKYDDYVPPDIRPILNQNRPIIGYYGALSKWIDYELIKKIASTRNYNIVLIGQEYDNTLKTSNIQNFKNIYYLGCKDYKNLKYYSKYFDVCIIPFKIYDVTVSVSPVKLYEYMAQKKVIVSTNIPECKDYMCLIGENYNDFIKKIDYALNIKNDVHIQNKLYEEASNNTWDKRGKELHEFIDKKLNFNEEKLLTVVVPAYNMENYLDRCLGSFIIKEKLMKFLDIIVVNDGSTDNTLNIALKYENKYPDVFRVISKENGGHGSAINTGIANAKGKFFKVVDADDSVNTSSLINHLIYLLNCKDDMIITNYCRCFIDGKSEIVSYKSVFESFECKNSIQLKSILKFLNPDIFTGYFHMHSITYKTDVLLKSNLKCLEKTFYVDEEYISVLIPYVKSIGYQDIELYQYTLGRADQSVNIEVMKKRLPDIEKITYRLMDYYKTISDYVSKEYLSIVIKHHASTQIRIMREMGVDKRKINELITLFKYIGIRL